MSPLEPKGSCWSCGKSLTEVEYGRTDSCPNCNEDTHVCLNCDHHDPQYNNECRENQADRVVDKERSNFCDYFRPKFASSSSQPKGSDLLSQAEALFKKKN